MKIYFAHGLLHQLDGKWLEHQMTEWNHIVYNPFDGDEEAIRLTREWKHLEEKGDTKGQEALCNPIYEKDMAAINEADIVVVYYPDPSTGAAMEIPISKQTYHKCVVVLTDTVHPFTNSIADYILPLVPETIDRLKELLERLSKEK